MALSRMKTVAIHQPNFFPWLGYFKKIRRADVFVFMDAVKFSKGSFTNRARILVSGTPLWMTCPIVRSHSSPIRDIRINYATEWQKKIWKTIENNYRKTPYWDTYKDDVGQMVFLKEDYLAEYNIKNIEYIAKDIMKVNTEFIRMSELGEFTSKKTDVLIEIIQRLRGELYLAGAGASAYHEESKFREQGVQLVPLSYTHPVYTQTNNTTGDFVPGLSVLDALLNDGLKCMDASYAH